MLIYKRDGMKDKWAVVFRGTQKIGIDVADSFIGINSLPTPDPGCYFWDNPVCNTHVRSSLIDNWTNLNIKEVKVEFLTNGQTVAYVIFQNRATDNTTTWCIPENILNSSWTDLTSEPTGLPYFQLERLINIDYRRNFIIYDGIGGCSIAKGWMFVSEVTGSMVCPYEDYATFVTMNVLIFLTQNNRHHKFGMQVLVRPK